MDNCSRSAHHCSNRSHHLPLSLRVRVERLLTLYEACCLLHCCGDNEQCTLYNMYTNPHKQKVSTSHFGMGNRVCYIHTLFNVSAVILLHLECAQGGGTGHLHIHASGTHDYTFIHESIVMCLISCSRVCVCGALTPQSALPLLAPRPRSRP